MKKNLFPRKDEIKEEKREKLEMHTLWTEYRFFGGLMERIMFHPAIVKIDFSCFAVYPIGGVASYPIKVKEVMRLILNREVEPAEGANQVTFLSDGEWVIRNDELDINAVYRKSADEPALEKPIFWDHSTAPLPRVGPGLHKQLPEISQEEKIRMADSLNEQVKSEDISSDIPREIFQKAMENARLAIGEQQKRALQMKLEAEDAARTAVKKTLFLVGSDVGEYYVAASDFKSAANKIRTILKDRRFLNAEPIHFVQILSSEPDKPLFIAD